MCLASGPLLVAMVSSTRTTYLYSFSSVYITFQDVLEVLQNCSKSGFSRKKMGYMYLEKISILRSLLDK